MQVMGDDSLVLIDQASIDTLEYVDGNWTNVQHQSVNFTVNPYLSYNNGGKANDSVPHLTDTTLAAFNPLRSVVELYTRNADKSWTLVDGLTVDTTQYHANRIIWNGDDTVVLADTSFVQNSTSFGRILIYQKSNGSWNLTRIVVNSEVATLDGHFGYSMLLLDRNLIAIGAPDDARAGSVIYLQRNAGGDWRFTTRFIGRSDRVYFGFSLMKTDSEVIVQTASTADFPLAIAYQAFIPPCYLPIKQKCQNVTSDTCQIFSVSNDQLYTVGDSCTVVNLKNIRFEGDTSTLTFSFSRGEFDTLYCNSTITCVNPPVTPINPPVLESPVSAPVELSPSTSPSATPLPSPSSSPSQSAPSYTPVSSPFQSPSPASPVQSPIQATAPMMTNNTPIQTNVPVANDAGKVTSAGTRLNQAVILSLMLVFVLFSML